MDVPQQQIPRPIILGDGTVRTNISPVDFEERPLAKEPSQGKLVTS
jgi:hypothetical protein